jgi:hypothetical protein
MQRAIFFVSAAVLMLGLAAADAMAASPTPGQPTAAAGGLAWCGFKDRPGSRVRCGYSSESDCKQGIGGSCAICIVDPYLTEYRPSRVRLG